MIDSAARRASFKTLIEHTRAAHARGAQIANRRLQQLAAAVVSGVNTIPPPPANKIFTI